MFSQDQMRLLLKARPFVPFRLIRSDGDSVDVKSPEQIFPLRQLAIVSLLDPNSAETGADLFIILWYMHITSVEMLAPGGTPFSSPGDPPSGTPAPTSSS